MKLRFGATIWIMIGLAMALVASSRPPAAAGATLVLVSSDGAHWARSLSAPLFDPAKRWVPGDQAQESFWVRNVATDPGTLTLTARITPQQLFTPDGVHLTASTGSGWEALAPGQPAELARNIGPGHQIRVSVRADFPFSAGNHTQSRTARLTFAVTLAESVAGSGGSGSGPTGSQGGIPLPNTGATFPDWLLPLATVAVGTGLALVRRRRKGDRR